MYWFKKSSFVFPQPLTYVLVYKWFINDLYHVALKHDGFCLSVVYKIEKYILINLKFSVFLKYGYRILVASKTVVTIWYSSVIWVNKFCFWSVSMYNVIDSVGLHTLKALLG